MKKVALFLLVSFFLITGASCSNKKESCDNFTYSYCPDYCERVCRSSSPPCEDDAQPCLRNADCDGPGSCVEK
ncbi:MAG: hypothetical protein HOC78_02765 [Candidatus Komeilibacteria bacterium]|jgi:hypothetical protein|nr:hypothetical protein [Candidatus Komeilibacteria bacterium]